MALIIEDRVQENTGITGNSDYILLGAVTGFRTFGSVMANADTTYYAVTNDTDWEVGIGTYSTTGPTLARTTILASSNGGLAVSWSAGVKKIFLTYAASKSAYLDASGYLLVADRIAHTGDTDTAILFPAANTVSVDTGGAERLRVENSTITTTVPIALPANPTLALQATTKQYVDALIASGIHFHQPVRVENPANLNATYNNGTAGVGATLTNAGTQVALVMDGVTVATNDRVLVYEQTDQTQNGIYVVTNTGSGSTNWVLTRASDADTYVINSANGLSEGSTVFVQQGTTGAGETYTCNTSGVITFGTTNITFAQISSAQVYSAGSGLALTGTVFSNTAPDQVVTLTQGGVTTITGTYPNFTISTLAGLTSSVAELNVLTGMTASTAELNQLDTNTFTSAVAVPAGTVSNPAIYPTGDNNTGIFFPAADTIAFSEGGAEAMRITSAGDVGIGTTSPTADLSVGSATSSSGDVHLRTSKTTFELTPSNSDAGGMDINVGFVAGGQGPLKFSIGGAERARIDSSGNLLVGGTSGSDRLYVENSLSTAYSASNTLTAPPLTWFYNTNGTAGVAGTIRLDGGTSGGNAATTISAVHTGSGSSALTFGTRLSGSNVTERMRIDASGNVGIGTTSPSWRVDVLGSSPGYRVRDSGSTNGSVFQQVSGGNTYINVQDNAALILNTNNTERARIDSAGSVGIGTTTPNQLLDVNGTARITSLGVGVNSSGTTGEIRASNNITAYYSDDRLKTRIGVIDDPIGKVMSLSGFYYEANKTAQALGYEVKKEVGVSAQEVQAVMPEVVAPAPIDEQYLTVRYERLVPLLIEAIKAQQVQIDELRAKLEG
jgi:hypothetical protein